MGNAADFYCTNKAPMHVFDVDKRVFGIYRWNKGTTKNKNRT